MIFVLNDSKKRIGIVSKQEYRHAIKIALNDGLKQIYKRYPDGGLCHIVLDDLNVSDEDILFCLDRVLKSDELKTGPDRALFTHCLGLLMLLTEAEREITIQSAYATYHEDLDIEELNEW